MKRGFIVILSLLVLLTMAGCGKEKSEEETQIKQLVTGSPAPTVQPEADNPENTQTTDGVSMTNDYLNQKEAGQTPSVKDNGSVSSEASDSTEDDLDEDADGMTDSGSGDEGDTGDEALDSDGDEYVEE